MSGAQLAHERFLRAPRSDWRVAPPSISRGAAITAAKNVDFKPVIVWRDSSENYTCFAAVTPPKFGPHSMVFNYISGSFASSARVVSIRLAIMACVDLPLGVVRSGQIEVPGHCWVIVLPPPQSPLAAVLTPTASQLFRHQPWCAEERLSSYLTTCTTIPRDLLISFHSICGVRRKLALAARDIA